MGLGFTVIYTLSRFLSGTWDFSKYGIFQNMVNINLDVFIRLTQNESLNYIPVAAV